MRIATWNVNSLRVRLPQVLAWLAANPVDVLALQETKLDEGKFPGADFEAAGYHWVHAGQKTYNGVALIARSPLQDVQYDLPGFADPQRRLLSATVEGVRVMSLYAPNGQAVGSEKYSYKLAFYAALHSHLQAVLASTPELAIVGDYNVAPTDADVHDPAEWQGEVLVSEPERTAFQGLLDLGLHDCFRLFPQEPQRFSWWDYRQAAFRRNRGLRIDHILASDALSTRCRSCEIDVTPRRNEQPSDHTVVVASFE